MEFKEGVTVECIRNSGDVRAGKSFVITQISRHGSISYSGSRCWHDTRCFRIVQENPVEPALNDGARLPSNLPNGSAERKEYPLYSALFGQFPAACVAVAHHSFKGNQKHNPGKELQDNRSLSLDDADCILRHLMEGDYEGVAWRAMRLLQRKLEGEGASVAPLATNLPN